MGHIAILTGVHRAVAISRCAAADPISVMRDGGKVFCPSVVTTSLHAKRLPTAIRKRPISAFSALASGELQFASLRI
jgi:hypothetical protein